MFILDNVNLEAMPSVAANSNTTALVLLQFV